MCFACQTLQKIFNKSIQRAIERENKSLESRLKEKREYFLREVYERDHNTATNLLLETNDDEINQDSQVLDGKRWEDLLAESFIKREPSPFPPHADSDLTIKKLEEIVDSMLPGAKTDPKTDLNNSSKASQDNEKTTESKADHLPFDPYSEPFYKIKSEPSEEPIKTYCSHEWFEYQGAGTKSPETICRFCGHPKPAP